MRVTMQTLYRNILTNLNRNNVDMNRINGQISSGKQMSKISDNPVNLVNALGLRTNISEMGQYQKNLQYGTNVIDAAENSLTQMKDLVMRAKTLAIQQANAPMTAENRADAAKEINHLWDQAIILANTSVNGKYVFGGFRTAGYTKAEPAPFVQGARDGYFVNGATPETKPKTEGMGGLLTGSVDNSLDLIPGDLLINGHDVATLHNNTTLLTGTVDNTTITADDLAINGTATAADITTGAVTNGLNMEKAFNAKTVIEATDPAVNADLTTLLASTVFTDQAAGDGGVVPQTDYDFEINGVAVATVSISGDQTAAQQAAQFVSAINAISDQTGVSAEAGDGTNGGVAGGIVLKNVTAGDESLIDITNFNRAVVSAALGTGTQSIAGDFDNVLSSVADVTHNTGEITLSSSADFTLTSPNHGDDAILANLGLDGGSAVTKVPNDTNNDGDIAVSALSIDLGQDPLYGLNMAGTAALAVAINDPAVSDLTGVSAKLTTLTYADTPTGDADNPGGAGSISFYLNGEIVGVSVADGDLAADTNASLVSAINAKSELTGVTAEIGDGSNGAPADTLILKNTTSGDDSDIVISSFSNTATGTNLNLADGAHSADATHNTGDISLSGSGTFEISSDNFSDDTILDLIGLGGGDVGFADVAADGILRYGAALGADDFLINGSQVTTSADGISTAYADASAKAKADAINNGDYGVTAEVSPAWHLAASAVEGGSEASRLTGTVGDNLDISAGDLEINGIPIAVDLLELDNPVNGMHMQRATDFKAAINGISYSSGVTASLTTLHAGAAATTGGTSNVEFELNGVTVKVNANGVTPDEVARQVADAINAQSELTGVTASRGTGGNGGATNSIVLQNTLPGDETAIELSGLTAAMTTKIGLSDGSYGVSNGNTGQITFSSESAFTLFSPNDLDNDDILRELGLDGGEELTGIEGDTKDDGRLEYGSAPAHLNRDDLVINGITIFDKATAVSGKDATNSLLKAINAKQDETGVVASRDNGGRITLSALDGRNIQVQTTALGEKVTRLTGSEDGNGKAAAGDQVYFGSVRLWSDQPFKLESGLALTTGGDTETGFVAMGLSGGASVTGESGDTAGDGLIQVKTIQQDNEYVRYAGDRENDIKFQVGRQSTVEVSKNGYDAVMETGLFDVLKDLEKALLGEDFRAVTGATQAADTSVTLDSGETGLPGEELLQAGSFTITMTDHAQVPPRDYFAATIEIDPENDTLEDIAQRLNGIPGLQASWNDSGRMEIETRDQERYSFAMTNDTSNFLDVAGLEFDNVQVSSLGDSIADLDDLLNNLTNQIADFGARANRIEIQNNIYMNLEISTKENLSELEDTDLIQAVMELKAKELAYQASLNAAAKTMQLSLVDYL